MNEHYISNEFIEKTTAYFLNFKVKSQVATSLTLFLLFKATEISQKNAVSLNMKETHEKFINAVNLLMSFYAPWEDLSKKFSLLYPFHLKWKKGQSGSIGGRERWIISSNVYNLFRNAKDDKFAWITEIKKDDTPYYQLSYDYLDKLIKYCEIDEIGKIDISFLTSWALKYLNLKDIIDLDRSNLTSTKTLINLFYQIFNITEDEKSKLFAFNNLNLIEFSNVKPDFENNLRKKVGYMDDPDAKNYVKKRAKATIPLNHYMKGSQVKMKFKNPTVEYISHLLMTSKQIILYGPLGTGKTKIAEQLIKDFDDSLFVQFHPNYGYEEFIGALIPEEGNLVPKEGLLVNFLYETVKENPEKNYLLIIDEINRGNLSKIFGEVFASLDRDRAPITLSYDPNKSIKLPDNLYIIGTMNSVDRSIALVDYALRRRFEFIYLEPDSELLDNVTNDQSEDLDGISIGNLFNKINKNLKDNLGKDYCLGHAFFMPLRIKNGKEEYIWNLMELERTVNHLILPLIEEFCFGNEALLISVLGEDLIDRLTGDSFKSAMKRFLGV